MKAGNFTADLFSDTAHLLPQKEKLAEGAFILRGFLKNDSEALINTVQNIIAAAPLRHMTTPGGYRMSVAMTNCGKQGWITDRRGYRYDTIDPETAQPWPAMPALFIEAAKNAAQEAGFNNFMPDACLINCYQPGARLSLHQDKNEHDFDAPIVSVSLGLPATFLLAVVLLYKAEPP